MSGLPGPDESPQAAAAAEATNPHHSSPANASSEHGHGHSDASPLATPAQHPSSQSQQHHQQTTGTVPASHNTTSVYHAAVPAVSGAPVGVDFASPPIPPPDNAHAHTPSSTGHAPPTFAAPSSFLRPLRTPGAGGGYPMGMSKGANAGQARVESPLDREHREGLKAIRAFLKVRTSYDVLPLSFRLIVFDTALLVKKSLNILNQNGIVSAPLWDSRTSTFAGLLTTSDYINVIQYYWQNPDAFQAIDQFRLNSLPDVERAIGVQPLETVSINPDRPLYEACRKMITSKARRIPLVDFDDETQRAMVVSVVTQYRILKFVAVNVKETMKLRKPLKEIRLGSYQDTKDLAVAKMETPVMDVIHMLVKRSISSVPILDRDGVVINVFEAVDVITLIKGGVYDDLNLTVGEALLKRSEDFSGIYTCTLNDRLDTIFDTIRKSRVHRLVVIDEHSRLKGMVTLSDILEYILLEGLDGDGDGSGETAVRMENRE